MQALTRVAVMVGMSVAVMACSPSTVEPESLTYVGGKAYQANGKPYTGKVEKWYSEDHIASLGEYDEGVPVGTHSEWYENRIKRSETIYEDGVIKHYRAYDDTGLTLAYVSTKDGRLDGKNYWRETSDDYEISYTEFTVEDGAYVSPHIYRWRSESDGYLNLYSHETTYTDGKPTLLVTKQSREGAEFKTRTTYHYDDEVMVRLVSEGREPGEEMRPYAEIVQAPPELKFERLYGDRTMRFLRSYKVQATWRLDAEQRGTIVTVLPEKVSGFADILFTPAGEVRYDRCYINDDAFLYYEPSEADNCKTHYGELEQLLTTPEMTYFLEQNNLTY